MYGRRLVAVPAACCAVTSSLCAVVCLQGYGLCETNSITTSNSGEGYKAHPMSCGRPVLNVDVGIYGPDGARLPTDEVGEIWIRGPTVMRGAREAFFPLKLSHVRG